MRSRVFFLVCLAVAALVFALARMINSDYLFFAGYVVLQFVVLATAWNILGGYCGYVNFGSAAFFAVGAYTSVFFHKTYPLPVPVLILLGGLISGIVGFGMGYLTLRLRGAFFAIATLALAVVLQTLIVNWQYVGGSRGAYAIRPPAIDILGVALPYMQYLFLLMLLLAAACGRHRTVDRTFAARLWLCHHPRRRACGRGLRRADAAAEADRDHTLRRADGHGRRAVPLLHHLHRTLVRVRARLRGQLDRHADDRRHQLVDRPAGRRDPAWLDPGICARDHFVRRQPADRGRLARPVCHHRAEWAGWPRPRAPEKEAMMAAPLLHVSGVGKRFGGFVALDGINLEVAPGERLGLIGPNGSGKSTLVNCICGTLQNETGSVHFDGRPVDGMPAHKRTILGLARSFQLPRPFHSLSVAENLRIPLLYAVKARLGPAISSAELDAHCVEYLRLVGLDHKAAKQPRDLTQVEMRKLELARAMAAEPKLLIADESMAGLSHSEIEDILKLLVRLSERGITIILIEHIMSAVMSFSQRLAVLVSGKKIADGKPDEVVRNPEVEKAYLG